MKTPYTIVGAGLACAGLMAAPLAFSNRLMLHGFAVPSAKVTRPVRLVFLSDLHNSRFGPNQRQLLDMVAAQRPHAVLLGGDMAEMGFGHNHTMALLAKLARRFPCYYVSGNHECWSGHLPRLKRMFRHLGVTVLEGEKRTLVLNGQRVQLFGVDDPETGRPAHLEASAALRQQVDPAHFSVFLAHRPELTPWYATGGYDLIFAGHAHGGQWRLPPFINGLFSPDQGLFPAYVSGLYHIQNSTLIVGNGLAKHVPVPRIFNRPEVVLALILPRPAPPAASGT